MTLQRLAALCFCTLSFAFSSHTAIFGDDPTTPIQIRLHPQPAPIPALKYRLLPGRLEQTRGNAAVHYGKVTAEENHFFNDKKIRDNLDDWQDAPLEDLRDGKVHLPSKGSIEASLRRGALCQECDWMLPVGEVPFYRMLLPEVQQLRQFGRILAVRARIQMADHEYDNVVSTLQTSYALGRHAATGETIVNGLVGIAICQIMNTQTTEFVQQLGAPNLYWALTTLPTPLIDMRRALEVEQMGLELSFPEIAAASTAKKTPDEWRELYLRIFDEEIGSALSDNARAKWPASNELNQKCSERLPEARKYLIKNGLPSPDVEKMPIYQVAMLYSIALYHENVEEAIKCYYLPYPQASAGIDATIQRVTYDGREIAPISGWILPAVRAARGATARLDRNIAVLRVLEALRIYAAAHADKLPEKLADITEVPIPNDPVTGQPFEFGRKGEKAYLRGPILQSVPLNYEITMVARH
jgi:hypothetical protein